MSGGREGKFYRVIVIRVNTSWGLLVKAVEQALGIDPFRGPPPPRTELRKNFLEKASHSWMVSDGLCAVSISFDTGAGGLFLLLSDTHSRYRYNGDQAGVGTHLPVGASFCHESDWFLPVGGEGG